MKAKYKGKEVKIISFINNHNCCCEEFNEEITEVKILLSKEDVESLINQEEYMLRNSTIQVTALSPRAYIAEEMIVRIDELD